VSRVHRLDRAQPLAPPQRTLEGYLRVDGRVARIGIQEYRDGAGNVRRELRLPEEVFAPESLASFHLVPVTNGHPSSLLDASNAKSYAIGAVGDVRRDGDYVAASLLIHDARAIADIQAGRQQLSNGYTCELDDTPGVWNGQRYDSVQRGIRGNHLAIVDVARAGPEARLRLDAGDAIAITTNTQEEQHMSKKSEHTDANPRETAKRAERLMRERTVLRSQRSTPAREAELARLDSEIEALSQANHDGFKAKQKADQAAERERALQEPPPDPYEARKRMIMKIMTEQMRARQQGGK
jgi:hypothetical protein